MGDIPDRNSMPLDISDFPLPVTFALDLYGKLGDRYATTDLGLLYIGKDLATLPLLFSYSDIPENEHCFLLDIIHYLDARAVRDSAKRMQNVAKKLKAKQGKK
jgi:hypothetical protein